MKQPSLNSPVFSHKSSGKVTIGCVPIRKVHVCMYVCVQLPRADRLPRFSIENVSKRPDYPTVVYCGVILVFGTAVIQQECCSQGRETRPNREAIAGCSLRVGINVYSTYSYKCGMCVGFWRDCAANMCLASMN